MIREDLQGDGQERGVIHDHRPQGDVRGIRVILDHRHLHLGDGPRRPRDGILIRYPHHLIAEGTIRRLPEGHHLHHDEGKQTFLHHPLDAHHCQQEEMIDRLLLDVLRSLHREMKDHHRHVDLDTTTRHRGHLLPDDVVTVLPGRHLPEEGEIVVHRQGDVDVRQKQSSNGRRSNGGMGKRLQRDIVIVLDVYGVTTGYA